MDRLLFEQQKLMRIAKEDIPIRIEVPTEMILFSPQHEHGLVIDHILKKVQG